MKACTGDEETLPWELPGLAAAQWAPGPAPACPGCLAEAVEPSLAPLGYVWHVVAGFLPGAGPVSRARGPHRRQLLGVSLVRASHRAPCTRAGGVNAVLTPDSRSVQTGAHDTASEARG